MPKDGKAHYPPPPFFFYYPSSPYCGRRSRCKKWVVVTTKRLGGVPHVLPGSKCHSFVWKKVQELLLKARRANTDARTNRTIEMLTNSKVAQWWKGRKTRNLSAHAQRKEGSDDTSILDSCRHSRKMLFRHDNSYLCKKIIEGQLTHMLLLLPVCHAETKGKHFLSCVWTKLYCLQILEYTLQFQ